MDTRLSQLASLQVHTRPAAPRWEVGNLTGRIVELSGCGASARLFAAFGLVLAVQRRGEAAAWITLRESSFFPPDAAAGGVDLEALAVVRMADTRGAGRAADQLVRSGGFGLVVIDMASAPTAAGLAPPLLTRLLGLAQKHETAVIVLTDKPTQAPSISSLVSLRGHAQCSLRGDRGDVTIEITKDKRHGPGGEHREDCRAPAGLR